MQTRIIRKQTEHMPPPGWFLEGGLTVLTAWCDSTYTFWYFWLLIAILDVLLLIVSYLLQSYDIVTVLYP